MNKYDSYYYYYYYYDLVSGHQTAVTAISQKNSTFITPCKRTSVVSGSGHLFEAPGANISSPKRTDLLKLELTRQFHPIYTTPRSIFLLVNPDRIKK